MEIFSDLIKDTTPRLCKVDPDYLKFIHKHDHRISVKFNNRPFVALIVEINGFLYVVPLTSQTTVDRIKEGKKRRSSTTTTFIYNGKNEIANLLHNNMFPVPESVLQLIVIDPEVDTYLANEERYIRKHWVEINLKSVSVYLKRYDDSSREKLFLEKICCDFKGLEKIVGQWNKGLN